MIDKVETCMIFPCPYVLLTSCVKEAAVGDGDGEASYILQKAIVVHNVLAT